MSYRIFGWITFAWIGWALLGLGLEAVAIAQNRGTLSGHVWWTLHTAVGGPILVAFAAWLVWHFFLNSPLAPRLISTYVDDVLIAVVAALLTVLAQRWGA